MERYTPKNENEINYDFPGSLYKIDIALILKQCENQHATSKEQIEGFAKAYAEAKSLVIDGFVDNKLLSEESVTEMLKHWALTIEPRNEKGYRTTEVIFRNMNRGLNPDLIERAMNSFIAGYVEFLKNPTDDERYSPEKLYEEFQKIHPFEDGNGRAGDLLWKVAETALHKSWPEELPPKVF